MRQHDRHLSSHLSIICLSSLSLLSSLYSIMLPGGCCCACPPMCVLPDLIAYACQVGTGFLALPGVDARCHEVGGAGVPAFPLCLPTCHLPRFCCPACAQLHTHFFHGEVGNLPACLLLLLCVLPLDSFLPFYRHAKYLRTWWMVLGWNFLVTLSAMYIPAVPTSCLPVNYPSIPAENSHAKLELSQVDSLAVALACCFLLPEHYIYHATKSCACQDCSLLLGNSPACYLPWSLTTNKEEECSAMPSQQPSSLMPGTCLPYMRNYATIPSLCPLARLYFFIGLGDDVWWVDTCHPPSPALQNSATMGTVEIC